MEVQVATTCKCGEIHERFSEPRNSTELEYRTLSRRCYCRSCRQRRGLLEMRQCPLYTYWWRRGKKPALGCQRKVEPTAMATIASCYCWDHGDTNYKQTGSSYPCLQHLRCAFVFSVSITLLTSQLIKWQRRNKFTNS